MTGQPWPELELHSRPWGAHWGGKREERGWERGRGCHGGEEEGREGGRGRG
jgi:hypothetical protein